MARDYSDPYPDVPMQNLSAFPRSVHREFMSLEGNIEVVVRRFIDTKEEIYYVVTISPGLDTQGAVEFQLTLEQYDFFQDALVRGRAP